MRLRRSDVVAHVALIAAAVLAVSAYGDGLIVGDAYSELHVDPIGFFARMRFAWDPQIYLGAHTGWMHGYEGPYGWSYALFAAIGLPAVVAQRAVIFLVEWTIAVTMYCGLASLSPGMPRLARTCGAFAYLFNVYVAFNLGNGYSPFLMPYAMTPVVLGVAAAVLRGTMRPIVGACAVAVAVLVSGGVNPPLLVILAIVAGLYLIIACASPTGRVVRVRRALSFGGFAVVATFLLNAYWIWPFLDYSRTFWPGSQLDESPLMHNVDTSFSNVLRGFGQWGIFRGDANGLWFPWSAWFRAGFFYAISWSIPALAYAALVFRRARSPFAVYCVVLAAISIPIVVGYHSEGTKPALTVPIYDLLYSRLPGFQMFRSAYKWVWPLEFAIAGLLANAVSTMLAWAKTDAARFTPTRRSIVLVPAVLTTILPVLSFVPMLATLENHSVPEIPTWYGSERDAVGTTPQRRVALLPSQYVPQYDWADQAFYIENSFLPNDLMAGYISGAPNQGSHLWLTRAFHSAREGDPRARDMFRLLGAERLVARDDFRSESDFAYVGEGVQTDTTQAHDIATSVLDAVPRTHDGALRTYGLPRSVPDVYATNAVELSALPAVAVASGIDPETLADGAAVVTADDLSTDGLQAVIRNGLAISGGGAVLDALATTALVKSDSIVTSVQDENAFHVRSQGRYDVFALGLPWAPRTLAESWLLQPEQSPANLAAPFDVTVDGKRAGTLPELSLQWKHVGLVSLGGGWHALHVGRVALRPLVTVAFVPHDGWVRERKALERLATMPGLGAPSFERTSARGGRLFVPGGRPYGIVASPAIDTAHDVRGADLAMSERARDPDFDSIANLSGRLDVPYVPDAGTFMTSFRLLPKSWYTDPSVFAWSRGGLTDWCLLGRTSHFTLFSPGGGTPAIVRLRLATVGRMTRFRVTVDGRFARSFVVSSKGTAAVDALGVRGPLGVRAPIAVSFAIPLRRGVNDVVLSASDAPSVAAASVDPNTGDAAPVVAAMAMDASFTIDVAHPERSSADVQSTRLAPIRVPIEGTTIVADPRLAGRTTFDAPGAVAWLAELVRPNPRESRYRYRVLPISGNGTFDNALAAPLPNTFSDAEATVVRAWIVFGSSDASAYARNVDDLVDDVHLEADRRAFVVRSIDLERAPLDVSLGVRGSSVSTSIVRRARLVSIALPPKRGVLSATVTVDLPTNHYDDFVAIVKANDLTPRVHVDVREGSGWVPAGAHATVPVALVAEHGRLRSYRVVLPSDVRPTLAAFEDGRFVFRMGSGFSDCGLAKRDHVLLCVPVLGAGGRVSSFSLLLDGARVNRIEAYLPVDGTLTTPSSYTLSLTRGDVGIARRLRIVVTGDVWAGATHPTIVFLAPTIERSIAAAGQLPVLIDGAPFPNRRALPPGMHTVRSADAGADIDDVAIVPRAFTPPVRLAVASRRRSPVSLDVTLQPSAVRQLVVLNESFHPEWVADAPVGTLIHLWVDGFANGWLVAPHPGSETIRIRFVAQRGYDESSIVSVLAALAAAVIIAVARLRRKPL